jgi:hypothetical protein
MLLLLIKINMLDKEILDDIEYIVKNVPTLFKYLDFEGAKLMLLNSNLLFKNPCRFNDPYDCYLGLISFDTIPETYKRNLYLNNKHKLSPEMQKVMLEELMKTTDGKLSILFRESFLQKELPFVGISCFSEKYDKIMMWSHYAKYHEGVCIGLDTTRLINSLTDRKPDFVKVKYTEALVKGDYFSNTTNALINCFRTKYVDWGYEEEIRLVLFQLIFDEYNRFLLPIGKEIVTQIYLGSKIDQKNALNIISICKNNYPNAKVFKMELDEASFRLIPSAITY